MDLFIKFDFVRTVYGLANLRKFMNCGSPVFLYFYQNPDEVRETIPAVLGY